ncbi:hypothetical protein V6N12_044615 [Hibiscus sabdariffa]|uniref:Uncharacterized protein n=1 Tax=Hibiscus sabdariffa TaxID=183260 RepID=A0ABR2AXD6_9ROSI
MFDQTLRKIDDVEAVARQLHLMMQEPPAVRWAFIRKVYSILALQLLATVAVAATVVFVHPIARFIVGTVAGFALYIVILFTPLISAFLLPFVHCTSITRDIHGIFFCLEFSPLLSLLPLD